LYKQALPRETTEDVIMHGGLLYYQGMSEEKRAKGDVEEEHYSCHLETDEKHVY
jgi:hypothetical protein